MHVCDVYVYVYIARFLKSRYKLRFHFMSTALVLLRYTFSNSFLIPSAYKHASIRSARIAFFLPAFPVDGTGSKKDRGMSKYCHDIFHAKRKKYGKLISISCARFLFKRAPQSGIWDGM